MCANVTTKHLYFFKLNIVRSGLMKMSEF